MFIGVNARYVYVRGMTQMSNYYTEKIKTMIIYFIEEGELTLKEIADTCNVSLKFVRKTIENYEGFYANS